MPLDPTNALIMAPFAAVRRRNRSMFVPDARLTFALMHGVIVVVPRTRNADADWFVTAAAALGAVGEPIVLSSVIRVAVQLLRFANSSEKIGGAADAIGATMTCNVAAIRAVSPTIAIARRVLRCRRALISISLGVCRQ